MIFLNIIGIMRRVDPANTEEYDRHARECTDAIVNLHYHPELGCTLESVAPTAPPQSSITRRGVVNPGHDIECSWFLMEEANRTGDAALHKKAEDVFNFAIEAGWDKEYGGLLYFIDCKESLPPEAYEHDMKLWWPHNEIMIASAKAYRDTGDEYYLDWFMKTIEWCKTFLPTPRVRRVVRIPATRRQPDHASTKGSTLQRPLPPPSRAFHVRARLHRAHRAITTRSSRKADHELPGHRVFDQKRPRAGRQVHPLRRVDARVPQRGEQPHRHRRRA